MKLLLPLLLAALLLGGCAYATYSTDVQPIGGDTYSVGATAGQYVGGSAGARAEALKKANGYCAARDLQMKAIAIEPAGIRTNVTFMCLQPGDLRLAAPMPGTTYNVNVNAGR